ncbi:hypothetical protein BJ6T_31960 [Bradyrhizobium japonicum USDA 6]|nr:hypothetical protein BJ6T_31960 [Bradyrhizobium japonicum USDA 6]
MGGPIHELQDRVIRPLKPIEFIGDMTIMRRRHWIPPSVRHESIVEQVEAPQIFDVEMPSEVASQFDCSKKVKAEYHMSTVAKVDFTPVLEVIMFQAADVLCRFHEGRWSAANRTHSGHEMPRRNACDLCRDIRQPFNRQMAESAIQA